MENSSESLFMHDGFDDDRAEENVDHIQVDMNEVEEIVLYSAITDEEV